MQIDLNPELEAYIAREVAAGHFQSPKEVVEAALAAYQCQEIPLSGWTREELEAAIREGEESVKKYGWLTPEQVWQDLEKCIAKYSSGNSKADEK